MAIPGALHSLGDPLLGRRPVGAGCIREFRYPDGIALELFARLGRATPTVGPRRIVVPLWTLDT
jgi:hypothetical protein